MIDDIKKVVRNYAAALFECAAGHDLRKTAIEQLSSIAQGIESDEQLKIAMYSPVTDKEYKINLLKIIDNKLGLVDIVRAFLGLLIKNSRMSILPYIVDLLGHLLKEAENIKEVSIVSAKTLISEEKEYLKSYLENDLEQKVDIKFLEDPSIIAGVVIRYDSILLDYSIKGAMQKIKKISQNIKSLGGFCEA